MTIDHSTKLSNALDHIKNLQRDFRFEEALSFSTTLDFEPFPLELDIELAYCLMALGRPLPAFNRLQRAAAQLLQSYDPISQYQLQLALSEVYALHNELSASRDQLEMAENLSVYLPLEHQCHLYLQTATLWFLIGQIPRAQKALFAYEDRIAVSPDIELPDHDFQSISCLKYALAYSNGQEFSHMIEELHHSTMKAITLIATAQSFSEFSCNQLSQLVDTLPEGLWKRWLLKEALKKLMSTNCEHKPILDLTFKSL